MEQVKKILAEKTAMLDGYGRQIPPLADFSQKQDVPPGLLLGAALFMSCVMLLLFQGFEVVVTIYTVIHPGLSSIKAIESPSPADDKIWLTYWMIYGFLNVAETFLPFVFYFVPYWTWVRLGFFVWLLQFNGSQTFYETVLRDLLAKNKDLIQELIKRAQSATDGVTTNMKKEMSDPKNLLKAASFAA